MKSHTAFLMLGIFSVTLLASAMDQRPPAQACPSPNNPNMTIRAFLEQMRAEDAKRNEQCQQARTKSPELKTTATQKTDSSKQQS